MRAFILTLALAVAGCASTGTTPTPTSAQAQQTVFAAKSAYATALTAAVAYRRLPVCGTPVVLPCHNAALLAQIQKADTVANGALDAAEAAVRTPAVGTTARDQAVTTATSALAALNALLISIGTAP